MTLEEQAIAVGNDRKALRARLNSTKSVLVTDLRKLFKESTFDFDNKRLVSGNGQIILQWKVRADPGSPISYHNQQTSQGTVEVLEVMSEDDFINQLIRLTEELEAR